jgi:hypothetical protein
MVEAAVLAKTRTALKSSLSNLVQALGCPALADDQMQGLLKDIWWMLERDRKSATGNQHLPNAVRQPISADAPDEPDATIMNFSGAFSDAEHRNVIGRA